MKTGCDHPVAPSTFGAVQGLVSGFKNGLNGLPVIGKDRDSH